MVQKNAISSLASDYVQTANKADQQNTTSVTTGNMQNSNPNSSECNNTHLNFVAFFKPKLPEGKDQKTLKAKIEKLSRQSNNQSGSLQLSC